MNRVVAYASRSLKPSKNNYPAHKLEFLVLKWAITEKFHDYLYGATFSVVTDNNPLTYVLLRQSLTPLVSVGLRSCLTTAVPSVIEVANRIWMQMDCLESQRQRRL